MLREIDRDNSAGVRRARRSARRRLVGADGIARGFGALVRARFAIAGCAVLGGLLGAYQAYREPPYYDSTAEVLVRPMGSSNLTLVYSGSVHEPTLSIATEARILTSDTVLARVGKNLNLANDPRFASYARQGQVWDADQREIRATVIAQLRAGLSVRYLDRSESGSDSGEDSDRQKKRSRDVGPRMMYVSFSGADPTIGAAIVNNVIQTYEARTFELRHDAMMQVSTWLSLSMEDFKHKVEAEQRVVLQLQRHAGLLGVGTGENPDEVELVALNREADQAQARVRAVRTAKNVRAGRELSDAELELLPLRTEVGLAEQERAGLGTTFGPNHPAMKEIGARTTELRQQLEAGRRRLEQQLGAELPLAEAEATLISAEVQNKASEVEAELEAGVDVTTLQVQLARDSELYYVLVNNMKTAAVDAGYGSVTVQVLKEANVPGTVRAKDYLWRPLRYGLVGLASGMAVALVGMLFPGVGLSRVQRIEGALGMPRLAEVPWSVNGESEPAFSRAILELCDGILLSPAGLSTRWIVVTSGVGSQGTSTIAIGVAKALAGPEMRVLLIDANMRRPSVHRRLRLDGRVGLSSLLSGRVRLEDAVIRLSKAPGMDVIVAGPVPPKSLNLLEKDAMELLLEQVDGLYDCVILDTSPVVGGAEVAKILSVADLALVVVRRGSMSCRALEQTGDAIRDSEVPLAGFVQMT